MKKSLKRICLGVMLLTLGGYAENIYATFIVEPEKKADLAFSTSGTVAQVNVDIGSVVKKGEVIASLQNDDLKALLDVAKTNYKYAKKAYERQLKVKRLIDEAQLDNYAFKYEQAKAQLAYQQSLLDKTRLKAPFDGVIYDKLIEEGDVVSGAMIRTAMKLQSRHKRKLLLSFDQKYHRTVKAGERFVYHVDGDDTRYTGVIRKVYPYADYANRKIKAEVAAKDFTVGLFGEGYIHVDGKN
jgi:membrane fusion protein (multidrug efflux system)